MYKWHEDWEGWETLISSLLIIANNKFVAPLHTVVGAWCSVYGNVLYGFVHKTIGWLIILCRWSSNDIRHFTCQFHLTQHVNLALIQLLRQKYEWSDELLLRIKSYPNGRDLATYRYRWHKFYSGTWSWNPIMKVSECIQMNSLWLRFISDKTTELFQLSTSTLWSAFYFLKIKHYSCTRSQFLPFSILRIVPSGNSE